MLKRLLCIPAVFCFFIAVAGAQDLTGDRSGLEQEIQELKEENLKLNQQVESVEAQIQELLDRPSRDSEQSLDSYYSLSYEEDAQTSGFIRKGSLTGTLNKLLNVNLFMAARYSAIQNESARFNDNDGFGVPFTRLHLTGQAYSTVSYRASFEFANFHRGWLYDYPSWSDFPWQEPVAPFNEEELYEAALIWSPAMAECPGLESFDLTAGLTQVFLSPAGMQEPWMLDFIEYPLIVYRLMPQGMSRDVGAFLHADCMDQGRLKIWIGAWNGAHRQIYLKPRFGAGLEPVWAFDAWGNGEDEDTVSGMARVQVNVLDEEEFLFSVSGGVQKNRVSYREIDAASGIQFMHENKMDTIYDIASEFRFNKRRTWVEGEYIHTYLKKTLAPTEEGYFFAAGHCLDFLNEGLEVLGRYDRVKLDDGTHLGESTHKTVGLNYYFDPDHKNDAKVMLNYVARKDGDIRDTAFMIQFVLGF